MKTFALIAATATLAASFANANIIDFDVEEENVEVVTIDSANGPAGSMLSLFDFRLGEQGDKVGAVALNSGFDSNIRIQLDGRAQGDLLAVLTGPSGEVIDTHKIDVDDN